MAETKAQNSVHFSARVAQLDRALASEARGCGFDPRRAYHLLKN